MRLQNFINEKMERLPAPIKTKINREITSFLKPIYFNDIPLKQLFNILNKYGLVPLQEDNTEWKGMLVGGVDKTEQVYFNLGYKEKNMNGRYVPIINARLALSYYKMPRTGKYEIISYVG